MESVMGEGIRSYGPGKFSTVLDSYVYELSLDGGPDEEAGSVDEGGWYGFMSVGDGFAEAVAEIADEHGDVLTPEEEDLLTESVAVILHERSDGIVGVDWYDSLDEADEVWATAREDRPMAIASRSVSEDRMREARRPVAKHQAEAGFAIGIYSQQLIEENALERFGPRWGEREYRERALKEGWVDEEGAITAKGWELLNEDIDRIELNSLTWLRDTFGSAVDHGHDRYGDLVGSFTFDPTNPDHAWLVDLASSSPGRSERIDMSDASYGDLVDHVFDGVSDFGVMVLGGQITFHDVSPTDAETIEATLDVEREREKKKKQSKSKGRR
jgi:hypothetical protein